MRFSKAGSSCLALLFLPFFTVFGAELTVPKLELVTRGTVIDEEFALSTTSALDIALNGGYKYSVLLGLSLDAPNLGKAFAYKDFAVKYADSGATVSGEEYNRLADRYNNQAVFSLRVIKAIARDFFGAPLEFSFFTGRNTPFCSGDEFVSRWGIYNVGSDFTGYYYFPDGIGGNPLRRYDGLYSAQGTGISLALTKSEFFIPAVYAYQDFPFLYNENNAQTLYDKPRFSGDIRFLLNSDKFRADAFAGISGEKGDDKEIRGGLLALFSAGLGTEFLLQFGVPGYKMGEDFNQDNLFVLLEPRMHFGYVSFYTTFFYHPLVYMHYSEEAERGRADINFKLLFGDAPESRLQWGFDLMFGLKVTEPDSIYLKLGPFVGLRHDGLEWMFKFRLEPATDNFDNFFDIFMGIKTAF